MEKFSYENNGYNRREVNQFIGEVVVETEKLISKIDDQKRQIASITNELNHYKEIEGKLNTTLNQIEKSREALDTAAQKESDLIIYNAKVNASRIVNDALLDAKKMAIYKNNIQKDIIFLKNNIKTIVEQQKTVIKEIEDIENQ